MRHPSEAYLKAVPDQDVCVCICYSHMWQTNQWTGTQTYKHDRPHREANANANVLDWETLQMKITFVYKKINFVPVVLSMKFFSELSILVKFLRKTKNSHFCFQACHICANLANFSLNGNLDQKYNTIIFIFEVNICANCNLFFRVLEKGMLGLPYLRRGS